jgi:hypothetical protein
MRAPTSSAWPIHLRSFAWEVREFYPLSFAVEPGALSDFDKIAIVGERHMLPDLLHGEETKVVWCDAAYQGQTEVICL